MAPLQQLHGVVGDGARGDAWGTEQFAGTICLHGL